MYDRPSNERGIVERLRCMASPEAPYAIDSKALAMAAADAIERLTRERDNAERLADLRLGYKVQRDQLRAALAETEQKLDAWYRTEAQLHAAIHRHGGGDAVRAAIAELAISPIEHNPRLVVETAGGT